MFDTSPEGLLDLIKHGDSVQVEIRRAVGEDHDARETVARTLAAFANTSGGIMIVGVDYSNNTLPVHSFKIASDIKGRIENTLGDMFEYRHSIVVDSKRILKDGVLSYVVYVIVPPAPAESRPVTTSDGKISVRVDTGERRPVIRDITAESLQYQIDEDGNETVTVNGNMVLTLRNAGERYSPGSESARVLLPRVFIGSSKESLDIARTIQQELYNDALPRVWDQGVFDLSNTTIESLEQGLDQSDAAIFVFSPDDIVTIRSQQHLTARDNVVFELGLFIGRLDRGRTFIVRPRNIPGFHLPTDLIGVTAAEYNANRPGETLRAALGPACHEIRMALRSLKARPNLTRSP
jgi:predicted nucleotide-binding protein